MEKYVLGLETLTGILDRTCQSQFMTVQIPIMRKHLGPDTLISLGQKSQEQILSKYVQ